VSAPEERPPQGNPFSRARWAVSAIFFLNGLVLATWVSRIPEVKAQHALSDGRLGCVLLAVAGGAIVAMPIAGALVGALGSRLMTVAAALALVLALPLPLVSANTPLLVVSLVLLGAANGALDVSMNAQAVAVERRVARPIMSSFHALFSLGGLTGAALSAAAMALGVGRISHVGAIVAGGLATVTAASYWLDAARPDGRMQGPLFAWPSATMLALGGLTFLGLLAEGAMADWSAVYLHDSLGTSGSVAAGGFASFSLAMTFGRLVVDILVERFGSATVLQASSTLAALGLALGLAIGDPWIAIAGFGAVGFGIANIVPVLFRTAGSTAGVSAGSSLAVVATTGYFGFLAGPALIGFTAELTSLPIGLALVSAACATIACCSGMVADTRGRMPDSPLATVGN
jgi:MFS transporter